MIFVATMKWIVTFLILFTPHIDNLNMNFVCIDLHNTNKYMCSFEPCEDFDIGCSEYVIGIIDDFEMYNAIIIYNESIDGWNVSHQHEYYISD